MQYHIELLWIAIVIVANFNPFQHSIRLNWDILLLTEILFRLKLA